VAILIAILITFLIVTGILYFLSSQISRFGENLPVLKQKLGELLGQVQQWVQQKFNLSIGKQTQMFNEALNSNKAIFGQTMGTIFSTLSLVFLLPVYIFLFLFYKNLILNFLFEVFSDADTKQVSDILNQSKMAVQSYMIGLMMEMVVVAAMNSTALLILGVDYAILIGIMGAILNLLPYIGGLIAIALPLLIATMTQEGGGYSTHLGIIAAYLIIQFIDNNILIPRIVSSKVQINALFSIIFVLIGGALWGIGGMFLSIPFAGILKIVFDRIQELKPWGKLLGDEIPTKHRGHLFKRLRSKPAVSEKITKEKAK
jgi:predicted PurR-regulated permease PerM